MPWENDGPIPGENFTSDTKNYPWHQPPEYKNIKVALDKMAVKLTEKKISRKLIALAEMGFPLVRISQMIIMEGIGQGKWTLDMGLLLAGPFTKIIEIMCDTYGVEYTIGIEEDEDEDFETGIFFKGLAELESSARDSGVYKVVKSEMPKITAEVEEQAAPETSETSVTEEEPDLQERGFASMMGDEPSEEEEM